MTAMPPLVVHVVYRFAVGGLENGLVNLLNRLPQDSWRHAVIALADIDPSFARRVTNPRVEMIALNKKPGHGMRLYPTMVTRLRAMNPAIVHTRNLAALEMVPAAWAAGVPTRLHGEHGRDSFDPTGASIRRQAIRRLYRPFVSAYVTVSPDLKEYLCARIGVPERLVTQIWNGVDTRRFSPAAARAPIPGCPFADPETILVGSIGRLDPVKDHITLVEAFAALVNQSPELRRTLRLIVVGEGPMRAAVESTLEARGIRDLCWLAGERHDIEVVLRGLDVFALTSFGEGVSNVVLEAMATGLPIVATDVGANAELVEDGTSGTIVPARDIQAIATAIGHYVAVPSQAREHGDAARARALREFSLQRMVERYHELYISCASQGPRRGRALTSAAGCSAHS